MVVKRNDEKHLGDNKTAERRKTSEIPSLIILKQENAILREKRTFKDLCYSVAQSCPALCDLTNCSTPGFLVHHPAPRACSNSSVIPFSCLQSFPASGFFFNESALRIGWPKHWSFSFSISPSSEYSQFDFL